MVLTDEVVNIFDICNFFRREIFNIRSDSAGEAHPHAPKDPYVNLSIHPAPINLIAFSSLRA
jgi:hypothetical protein